MSEVFMLEVNEELLDEDSGEPEIELEEAAFTWGFKVKDTPQNKMQVKLELEEVQEPTIRNLTFKMKKGDMMLVAGRVGTGKTTLLHALMREIKTVSGKASIKGSIAYVEQEPFIFSASVKENVAFGLEFDQARFDYAVKVSQL